MNSAETSLPHRRVEQHILCVDDDPDFLASIEFFLPQKVNCDERAEIWYRFLFFESPTEALNTLKELTAGRETVAMVISDEKMARMRGAELLGHVKAVSPESVRVLLTGNAGLESAIMAINNQLLDKYLTKPIDDEHDFAVSVQQLLQGFQMKRAIADQNKIIRHLATHDGLTGLPNRTLMVEHLQQGILAGRRAKATMALMLVDLNRLKDINNTLGYPTGDRLLQEVGPRLRSVLRESDVVTRLGSDTFAVLLPDTDVVGVCLAADRVLNAFEKPFTIEGLSLEIRASIGITLSPQHGEEAEGLVRLADVALEVAKQEPQGYFIYSADQDHYCLERLMLMGELRHAIDHDELSLVYQPQIALQSGTVGAVEALVRWRHHDRGIVLPDQFITLAEHGGMIRPLTEWMLSAALRQCRAWHAAGLPLGVAVNLSARSLRDPHLPAHVANVLELTGVDPRCLELEITESVLMADPVRARDILNQLDAMGVRLAIDDFGTGYSSLAYLKKLPVKTLKIDKTFILNMTADRDNAVIVRSTIDLAHTLGLTVVAEGVENRETWDHLAALGCDAAQGYYMSRPLPAEDFNRWLVESPWGTTTHTRDRAA